jgi:hypothetical protein
VIVEELDDALLVFARVLAQRMNPNVNAVSARAPGRIDSKPKMAATVAASVRALHSAPGRGAAP